MSSSPSVTGAGQLVYLKPSKIEEAIEVCISIKQPVCLWGPPGIGKSQIIKKVARKMHAQCKDVRAVLLDPVDLRGLPHVKDGKATWATPDFLPTTGKGILFLDELNRAPQMVQNACFQLVLDRQLGEYTMPDEWATAAACNRESDGGGVSRMSSGLSSRFLHLNLEVDVVDWCKWAVTANVHPMVVAFVRWRQQLLHVFDTKALAFPCPRTWEFVSGLCHRNLPDDLMLALVAGAVGYGAAIEFMSFVRMYRSLPSIDAILTNPSTAAVPGATEVSTLFAVASALARRMEKSNIGRVFTYLDRLPMVEYNVMAVKDACRRNPELESTPEYTKWALVHSDVHGASA